MIEIALILLACLIGGGVYLVLAARSLLLDLWKLTLISELPDRTRAALACFCICGLPVAALGIAAFGPEYILPILFLIFTIAPATAWQLLTWWAWRTDNRDVRDAALVIAIERTRRSLEQPPSVDQRWPWKDYLYDVETARRRERYEPPPI